MGTEREGSGKAEECEKAREADAKTMLLGKDHAPAGAEANVICAVWMRGSPAPASRGGSIPSFRWMYNHYDEEPKTATLARLRSGSSARKRNR